MNFWQRLLRFGFGVLIGLALTGVFFSDRPNVFTSWLPGNVVKKQLRENPLKWSDKAKCLYEAYGLKEKEFTDLLKNGKVQFSESQTKERPYRYQVRSSDRTYFYQFTTYKDSTILADIHSDIKTNCE